MNIHPEIRITTIELNHPDVATVTFECMDELGGEHEFSLELELAQLPTDPTVELQKAAFSQLADILAQYADYARRKGQDPCPNQPE